MEQLFLHKSMTQEDSTLAFIDSYFKNNKNSLLSLSKEVHVITIWVLWSTEVTLMFLVFSMFERELDWIPAGTYN